MKASDIFIGPLLRRASPDLVVVALASRIELKPTFSVKVAGATDWLAHDDAPISIRASEKLFFYFGLVRPAKPFPQGRLLAYSIAVPGATGRDYAPFERVVRDDKLAYARQTLPTFFLPRRGARLVALYG